MNAFGQRRFRNILITGLPGVGKSTFAKAYAQMSRTELVELDQYVEKLAGKSINEIFAQEGEAAFRALEAQCLERLLRRQRCTIALGGGTLTHPPSLALARELGCIVLLTAPISVIVDRLWPVKNLRPLLADCDSKEQLTQKLEKISEERRSCYEAADLVLETSHSSVDTLKIELSWLERSILGRPLPSEAEAKDEFAHIESGLRRIPLSEPSYRSPREQKSGKESGDKLERLIKAQRQKDRSEKRDRTERKEKRLNQEPSQNHRARPENLAPSAPRPRSRPEGSQVTGPTPRPRSDTPQGPVARMPDDNAQGPLPRSSQGKPQSSASRPKPPSDARPQRQSRPSESVESGPRPVDKSGPVPRT